MFRIAIIGAGPAGCTLARLLLHKNVDVDISIFEGEECLDARTQGGTLDLHTESGIKALQECGLYDEFLKHARFDGEAFRVTNKYLQSFLHFPGTKDAKSSRGRPEIDRIQLRHLLLDSLPKSMILWNHKLDSVTESTGKYHLRFRNAQLQPQGPFDLVIGGDGCWSHVRRELTDQVPYYAGISGVSFQISNPTERCPDLHALVDRGSLFAFADHKGVMSQQLGNGSLSVSYWAVKDELWIKKFENSDLESMKEACLAELDGWNLQLRHLIEISDQQPMTRNLYMLPVGNTWSHRTGITLLGDAAHVMTPFAGEGVNLAMTDAMKLAAAIENTIKKGTQVALDAEIKAYEADMFKRAEVVQRQTYHMMNAGLIDDGALDKNIEKYIMTAAGDQLPAICKPVAWLVLKCIYGVWRWWNPPPLVPPGRSKTEGVKDHTEAVR